jgi:Uma2 family endonuclease
MATTEAATESEPEVEVEAEFPPHRMTIDRYQRLVESGVYGPDDPVFLWKGRLVEEMTKGNPHAFSSSSIVVLMVRLVPGGWAVRPDQPIVLSDNSMPEPDLAIVRGSLRDYLDRTPNARDLALVAEVADSSLMQDSVTKLKAYAADGVPVYWIVNLVSRRIEVYAGPSGPAETPSYGERREYGPDDEVPVVLEGREVGRIAAREILP